MTARRAQRAALATVVTLAASVLGGGVLLTSPAGAAGAGEGNPRSWPYWKTDLHAHSVTSGDATADAGIIADAAKARGFNAVFLTDHQAASYSPIGGVIAGHVSFEDDSGMNRQWDDEPSPATATASAGLSTTHVLNGTNSYRSAVSGTGEAYGWLKRGPNLRSGAITMSFSVYPTRIDPGSGVYVSFALGGDRTVANRDSDGYTTAGGTVLPDHSTTFVWQLGTPRVASDDGTTRVITQQLAYTLGRWNSYTIDVTSAINAAFPNPSTRPSSLNALVFIKMAAGSRTGGSAEGWFDTLAIDAADAPTKSAEVQVAAANDFVTRNATIHDWDTPSFLLSPGQEMGFNDHAQRLHFPITSAAEWQQFSKGVGGIGAVQAAGYPAMLNHPGLPGGVTDDEAISNLAYGADAMEAVERGTNDVMIRDWDALLSTGEPLVGTWTSDAHRNATFGPTTFLQAPVLSEPELLHSLFEGRAFLAPVDFAGQVSFTPDAQGGSYPARYPLLRSADDDLGTVHLDISGGLTAGWTVLWLRDGQVVRGDPVTGSSYSGSLTLGLPAVPTPVRAEVRRPDGSRALMTEPIMMSTVAGLPHGIGLHVERVVTPSGTGYTRSVVQGITGTSWDAATSTVTTTLQNPAGSTVTQVVATGSYQPAAVAMDGAALPQVSSRAALESGATDGWTYDAATHTLVVKATQQAGSAALSVDLETGPDTTPPTTPALTALALDAEHVALSWTESADDTGVTRYRVLRNGVPIAATSGSTLSYTDGTVSPDTSYSYQVRAEDASSNLSAPGSASVTTQPVIVQTVTSSADTYVASTTPTSSFGTAKTMRSDADPDTYALVRFPLSGVYGKMLSASVELSSTATLASGVRLRSIGDHSWQERTVTYATAPVLGAQVGASEPFTANGRTSTDVTSYALTAGSTLDLAVVNPSTTNVSIYTKENGTLVPQVVLRTSPVAPHADPVSVSTSEDTTATWVPRVSGGGGPLTCSIDTPPASGSAWVASDCSSGEVTPGRDKSGTSTFLYAVTDGVQRVTAQVTLTTTAVNDPPTTDPEELGDATDEDTPVTLTLRGDDVEGNCPLSFAIVTQPARGTLGPLGTPACAAGAGTVTVPYTPAPDFAGSDSLAFTVTDPYGAVSTAATFSITVSPVDDPPTAQPVSMSVESTRTVSWTPVVADVDSPTLTCAVASPAGKGTATIASTCASGTYASSGPLGADSFTYSVSDGTTTRTATASVTVTALDPVLLSDGFESGTLAAWPRSAGATVVTTTPRTGTYALRLDASSGGPAYARAPLPGTPTDTELNAGVRLLSAPSSGLTTVLRSRAADDTALVSVQVDSSGRLKLRNEVTRTSVSSTTALPLGSWAVVTLRVHTAGAASTMEVLVNGAPVPGLSSTSDLGSYRVAHVQVGENAKGPTGLFLVDDVVVRGT